MRNIIASLIPYLFIIFLILAFFIYRYSYKISKKLRSALPQIAFWVLIIPFLLSISWGEDIRRTLRASFLENYEEFTKTNEEYSDENGDLIPYIDYSTTDRNKEVKNNLIDWYLLFQLVGMPLLILHLVNEASRKKKIIN